MQATATSSNSNKSSPTISPINAMPPKLGPCEPKSVNSKWPATMFAAKRMASVAGRITFLTVSMITITGIKNLGVPVGTKWASKLLYWNTIDHNILPIHNGKDKHSVKDKCLVPVKI